MAHATETTSRLYIPTSNQTMILKEDDKETLITKDYLGSTREGAYYPYGTDVEDVENLYDRQFTGHRKLEDTGIYHAAARFYSPQLGAFIQADKVEGPNRYGYVQGNPIKNVDRTGTSCTTSPLNFPDIGCNDYRIPEPITEDLAPEYWNRLRDATMMVRVWEETGFAESGEAQHEYKGYGSGVSIGPGKVLTNRHVAAPVGTYSHELGHPYAKIGKNGISFFSAEPEWVSKKNDIAMMGYSVEELGGGFGIVPIANNQPDIGDPIFGLGYAGYTLNRKGSYEIKPIRGRVIGYDSVGNMLYAFGSVIDNGREDIPFSFAGRSGSGLVNAEGELVGIHYSSSGTFKTQISYPGDVANVMLGIRGTAVQYGYNPSYIEGIGYAVPIDKYTQRK
ncbi:MAG: hypothetical protein UZ22_OP11002000427 [Microgenomates bacterium OLB23]|nr:MAG: hypothetical protein UZ22_OP11002000427 [Microgenomates bacterium OLB23]